MSKQQALEGLKVVEFAWAGVGPLIGQYLANHGAMVIRVETHTSLDTLRNATPYKDGIPDIDRALWFAAYNTGKYGMTLNLNMPKAREVGSRLASWADVVTESYTPGTMRKWGLDYESLSKINPEIVYLSTCQQGQDGPYALARGWGFLAAAQAGFFHLIGWPDRAPGIGTLPYADFVNPRFGAAVILAALEYRRRTGKGQYIDQSQFETALHFLAPVLMDFHTNGKMTSRNGNRNPVAAPHQAFPCLDGCWIAIAVFTDEEWVNFCNTTGHREWVEDSRFNNLQARKENEAELERLISQWTLSHKANEIESLLQTAGVAAGVVNDMKGLFEDEQLKARNHFASVPHPAMGSYSAENHSFRLSKTPSVLRGSPRMGEHNEFVYKEILGYSDEEVANMLIEHVITTDADLAGLQSHV